MIRDLKPYPVMVDSGVKWLGKVPEHWEVRRLKHVSRLIYGDSLPNEVREIGHVAVYGSNGPVGSHVIPNTHSPCIIVGRKGSFGKVRYCDEPVFAIDTTYFIDDRATAEDIRWLFYVLRWLRLDGVSKDSAVPGLDRGDAYEQIVATPTLPEQTAIVKYLDYVDRRIRRLVRAKRKLIALLTEQKQAIIHQAVTRGLDPDVPLKDSGVEWIGKVPEHWEVLQIRRFVKSGTTVTYGIVQAGPDFEGGIPYIRTSDMKGWDLPRNGYLRTTPEIDESYRRSKVEPGDLVVAIRATLGKGLIVPQYLAGANLTQGTARISPGPRIISRFLFYAFNSRYCQEGIKLVAKGTTFLEITLEALRKLLIAVPPPIEQGNIVDYIDQTITDIDTSITRTHREIDLLNEYRTRLIADVVTGKLDVREAAAALPEVDPLVANGEPDDTLDNGVDEDLDEMEAIPEEDEA